jgi:PAS domain S-box-containing protein
MTKPLLFIVGFFTLFVRVSDVFAREYVVIGDADYAPFSFVDATGKASGLDVDVLEAIFASSESKFIFQFDRWDRSLRKIQSGEADIILGIIYSEERESYLDFSIPIHTEYYSIFIRKNLPFVDIFSLYDYKPVVLEGDVSIDKYLIPMGLFKDYTIAESLPEALSRIEDGLADYVIAPNVLGLNEIRINRYQQITIRGPSIIPSIYCMAVRTGDSQLLDKLNHGIMELRKNGKLLEIQEKWKVYEEDTLNYREMVRTTWIVLVGTIIVLISVIVWVWLLRVQIRKKTESIHLKNQELKKSEEKFRVITENSSDVIWHLDANLNLTYISPADERIRGFKKEEVLGKSLFSILKPEGIELLKEANQKRLNDMAKGLRSAPAIYELEELCKDGSWVWVEATATAFYDQDGNISGYHGVSRDISERKKAELLLKERERQLSQLNSTKDKLFSIIAHDLRSPFNAVLGLSELLLQNKRDFESTESVECLKMIHSSARNTLTLLDNLLTWAKSQTGHTIYSPEKAKLACLISEILEGSESLAKIKHIAIQYTPLKELEVYADVNMLKAVLRNLVSNAIKYTHLNGTVTVFAQRNQEHIEITVADNGVGMTQETQDKLFAMDTNVTTAGTANEKGSGLGLILCKDLIEQHGGKIWVQSEWGKGSAFTISLPCSA